MSSFCRSSRRPSLLLLTAALLAGLLAPAAGEATTVVRLDDRELVQRAELIVTGECVEAEPAWLRGRLVTLHTVRVTEVLAGSAAAGASPGHTITVVVPGGVDRMAGLAEVWPGAPSLALSEHALLFLHTFPPLPASWSIVGFSQGKFTLGGSAGAVQAHRDLSGVRLLEAVGVAAGADAGDGDPPAAAGTSRSDPLTRWRRLIAAAETATAAATDEAEEQR